MLASSTSRIRPGRRPRVAARALALAAALVGIAVVLRVVAPSLLLGVESALLAAVAGLLLAVGVGYYGESVLVGVLVAALPVFAVDAASTAVSEPATLGLAVQAVRGAAWYTLGVAVLLAGPSGYAIGALPRLRDRAGGSEGGLGVHRSLARDHLPLLLAWGVVAGGVVVLGAVLPTPLLPSSVAASPILAGGGLVVAAALGYRGPGALLSVVSAGIGLAAGLLLFAGGFVHVDPETGARTAGRFAATLVLVGFAAGVPYGLVGYVVGRSVDD